MCTLSLGNYNTTLSSDSLETGTGSSNSGAITLPQATQADLVGVEFAIALTLNSSGATTKAIEWG